MRKKQTILVKNGLVT